MRAVDLSLIELFVSFFAENSSNYKFSPNIYSKPLYFSKNLLNSKGLIYKSLCYNLYVKVFFNLKLVTYQNFFFYFVFDVNTYSYKTTKFLNHVKCTTSGLEFLNYFLNQAVLDDFVFNDQNKFFKKKNLFLPTKILNVNQVISSHKIKYLSYPEHSTVKSAMYFNSLD